MTTWAEERVLKPLDPVPDDVNQWPDFALRDVKVFHQGKGRYADLLEASPEVPLCVLGELMPLDDEQEHLALIEDPEYIRMKIENVTNYSFGQDDNGKPVVWAAGRAGWYEITPSDRYLQHYNDTIEAIDLFYFMVDQYQKLPPKRQRLGFQVDPFLTAYQKHTDFRIDDDDEAMETVHKHHKFLMKQMIEEREDIDWSQTHLWKHLLETYAEELDEIKATIDSFPQEEVTTSEDEHEAHRATTNGFDGASDATSTATSHTPETTQSDPSSETEEDETDWTRTIFDLLNVLRKTSTFDIRTCGMEKLASELVKSSAFPGSHRAALAAIERSAEPLLRLMNEAKLRKKFNWSTRAIYAELEATLADEIAEEVRTPAGKTSKDRHRMKSVLRPSGATKSTKRNRDTQTDDDEEEVTNEQPATSSPVAKRQPFQKHNARSAREHTADTVGSRDDSPSRQLNGHYDPNALPELPPPPEAQEMIDLVQQEARRVGRQNQTSFLQAFLGGMEGF